jgi:hypothetical protein
LIASQAPLNAKLTEPQQKYEASVKLLADWEVRFNALVGSADGPDSREGIKAQLSRIKSLPAALVEMRLSRSNLTASIFQTLAKQRKSRESLYRPVQDVIDSSELIRDDYKLQFRAALAAAPHVLAANIFDIVKQNYGEFRGEEESHATTRKIVEKYSTDKEGDVVSLANELLQRLQAGTSLVDGVPLGVAHVLRVNKNPAELYNYISGLEFLELRYTLLFQDTQIDHLSPGQRGALLLIFYLLVDKGHNPIVLDQPEENLDNETIVTLLVPVLLAAKKRRQIFMVTHNPNLAVVCDAEQIVYASFARAAGNCITYTSGSIENPEINRRVVDVLEGTKPAFENRGGKYH